MCGRGYADLVVNLSPIILGKKKEILINLNNEKYYKTLHYCTWFTYKNVYVQNYINIECKPIRDGNYYLPIVTSLIGGTLLYVGFRAIGRKSSPQLLW